MNRLKELRQKRGYTQKEVSLRTGISTSTYSRLERGISTLKVGQSVQLAMAFDTSVDYLWGLTDDVRPYPRSR